MKLDKQPSREPEKCELCGQNMNPKINIYNAHFRLCSACFNQMERLPEKLARGVERFMIGNVV